MRRRRASIMEAASSTPFRVLPPESTPTYANLVTSASPRKARCADSLDRVDAADDLGDRRDVFVHQPDTLLAQGRHALRHREVAHPLTRRVRRDQQLPHLLGDLKHFVDADPVDVA